MSEDYQLYTPRGSAQPLSGTSIRRETHAVSADSPPLDRHHDHTRGMQGTPPTKSVSHYSPSVRLTPSRITSVATDVDTDDSPYHIHHKHLAPRVYHPINNVNVSPSSYHTTTTSSSSSPIVVRREYVVNASPISPASHNDLHMQQQSRSPPHYVREQVFVQNSTPEDVHRHMQQQSQDVVYVPHPTPQYVPATTSVPPQNRFIHQHQQQHHVRPAFPHEEQEDFFDINAHRNRFKQVQPEVSRQTPEGNELTGTVYRREYVPYATTSSPPSTHTYSYTTTSQSSNSPRLITRETPRNVERTVYNTSSSPQHSYHREASTHTTYSDKPEPLKRQPKPYFDEEFYQDRPAHSTVTTGSPVHYQHTDHVNNAIPQHERVKQYVEHNNGTRVYQSSPTRQPFYPNNY
jgi:hypothetical protein